MCKLLLDVPVAAMNYVYLSFWTLAKDLFTIQGTMQGLEIYYIILEIYYIINDHHIRQNTSSKQQQQQKNENHKNF